MHSTSSEWGKAIGDRDSDVEQSQRTPSLHYTGYLVQTVCQLSVGRALPGPWWKDHRERQEEQTRARAAAKARKRAKAERRKRAKAAARRERMHFGSDLDGGTEAEAISGGDAKLAGDAIPGGDAITAKQRKRVKLDGDLDAEAEAISGGDAVLASEGDKYESFTDDGTFYEANVGGDDDGKYGDDLSIAEVLPAPCDSDRMFGMCFPNVNVERVFLYFL